jgi:hypothetical protein
LARSKWRSKNQSSATFLSGQTHLFCPQCLTEYRDCFVECADCRVPLVPGPPPSPPDLDTLPLSARLPPETDLSLVTVLEARDSFAMYLAKASLEDAGIEYVVVEGRSIQVAREYETEARELLAPLQEPLKGTDAFPAE